MTVRLTLTGVLLFCCQTPGTAQVRASAARFTDSALVDFTGDGSPEVWKVEAIPVRRDSLRMTMSIIGTGRTLFAQTWSVAGSTDSSQVRQLLHYTLDRQRLYGLDTFPDKPWSADAPWFDVARQMLVQEEGMDSTTARAAVDELLRAPRTVLQTTVARDASVFRVWSDRAQRFVVIGRCC